MPSQINLFENLILVFGNVYIAYALITIFFLYTGIKSSIGLKTLLAFISIFTILFGFIFSSIIISTFGIVLAVFLAISQAFDWVR